MCSQQIHAWNDGSFLSKNSLFLTKTCVCMCSCVPAYRLYTVVPKLVKFVDMLTNWYVRMNRRRLKVGWSVTLTPERAISAHSVWFEGTLLCNTSIRSVTLSWVMGSVLCIIRSSTLVFNSEVVFTLVLFWLFLFCKKSIRCEGEKRNKAKDSDWVNGFCFLFVAFKVIFICLVAGMYHLAAGQLSKHNTNRRQN